jgi:arabinan endo-1,5-alpha-L-arabinosidase
MSGQARRKWSGWRGRGSVVRLAVAVVLVAVGLTVVPPAAAAVTVDTGTWYVLVNRHSGKALDDYNLDFQNGAKVVQWSRNDGPWQQWQFIDSGDGYYRLRNQHSNKVLDVYNWSTADGASVVQWPDLNGANQQFRLVESDGGYVRLINRNSGKALEVYNWSTADGADVKQWTDLNGANQQWQLVPVGSAAYPDPGRVTGYSTTHDPSVVKKPDGTYLLAATDMGLLTSADRVAWTKVGKVFANGSPSWTDAYTDPETHMLWAPDISYRNGKYYMYYSASNMGSFHSAIGLATSTTGNPGSWVDHGKVIESQNTGNWNAIDPNLVVDDLGRWWLAFGSYGTGIKLVRLDPATGKRFDNKMVGIADRSKGSGDKFYGPEEAAFIVKRGSYYYLYTSFDHCCAGTSSDYRVMVARSTSVTGPYVDKSGLAATNGGGTEILAGHGAIHGPGHQAVLADTDGDILFYHYYPESQIGDPACHYCKLGINRIGYDAAGWPYVY